MSKAIEDIEYVDPNLASIIESLRSIGYSLETACKFRIEMRTD